MKFSIAVYDKSLPEKKNYRTVAECATLEDACAALLGLANARRGQEVSFTVLYRRRRKDSPWGLCGISCQFTNLWPDLASLIRQGREMIARHEKSHKESAARFAWLKERPRIADFLMKDEPLRAAFNSNNFAAAESRAQELGIAA